MSDRPSRDRRHRGRVPTFPVDNPFREPDILDRVLWAEAARMRHERRMKEIREMDIPEDLVAPLAFDYTNRAPGFDPDAMLDVSDLSIDMAAEESRSMKERLDYELRGAWQAGYDYVHVYKEGGLGTAPLGKHGIEDTLTFTQYVLPSNSEHPIRPGGVTYAYTYDLTSVPDHVLRAASRGELDKYERINTDR